MNKPNLTRISCIIGGILGIYLAFSFAVLLGGMRAYDCVPAFNYCRLPASRIERFFPAFRLGCWLAAPEDSDDWHYIERHY